MKIEIQHQLKPKSKPLQPKQKKSSWKNLQTLSKPKIDEIVESAVEATLKKLKLSKELSKNELSVVIADNKTIQSLNNIYRKKDYATNVLSFPYINYRKGELMEKNAVNNVLGEIVISLEKCAEEAEEQGKELKEHFTHLIIHSMLHLLGYDHERSKREAAEMEGMEIEILDKDFGVHNPYLA